MELRKNSPQNCTERQRLRGCTGDSFGKPPAICWRILDFCDFEELKSHPKWTRLVRSRQSENNIPAKQRAVPGGSGGVPLRPLKSKKSKSVRKLPKSAIPEKHLVSNGFPSPLVLRGVFEFEVVVLLCGAIFEETPKPEDFDAPVPPVFSASRSKYTYPKNNFDAEILCWFLKLYLVKKQMI